MGINLYKIIKAVQSAQGSNAKTAILMQHKDNALLKAYMKAVMDPSICYYQTKCQKTEYPGKYELKDDTLGRIYEQLAQRAVTGDAAKRELRNILGLHTHEGQELISLIIKRSVGNGIGNSMVLKVWPKLYFSPPYMRCSLLDTKTKAYFASLKRFFVQKKADGSYATVVKTLDNTDKAFTRAGSYYPTWLVERLLKGAVGGNYVFIGELLVWKDGSLLKRQDGNGIYNSIIQGEPEESFAEYTFQMEAWDLLSTDEFEAGYSSVRYEARLDALRTLSAHCHVDVIESVIVHSLKEAKAVTIQYQKDGFEGSIYKDPDMPWKDHTSTLQVKDKVVFEAEYRVTAQYEGTGKAKGMLGGITIETSDGLLRSNCGTGFSDKQRKEYWENSLVGSIVTASANEVISKRGETIVSLFLPVFEEVREFDKREADSLARVLQQFEAAKGC